jgi:hypothetical protein
MSKFILYATTMCVHPSSNADTMPVSLIIVFIISSVFWFDFIKPSDLSLIKDKKVYYLLNPIRFFYVVLVAYF